MNDKIINDIDDKISKISADIDGQETTSYGIRLQGFVAGLEWTKRLFNPNTCPQCHGKGDVMHEEDQKELFKIAERLESCSCDPNQKDKAFPQCWHHDSAQFLRLLAGG